MEALIGQTIKGCYRVDTLLGRGGMAEVYKVLDLQRGVPLAMKVLREDLAEDRVFLRRFEREAHNLAKMQHPNIVRFYGLEQEKYLAFILMDYIQGPTLRKIIFGAEGPLKNQQVLEIMQPVCSALHYAHQQGIVHCDLKSANIMLDKGGKVYLTDFGIARMMDMATSTMVGIGTPAYMAPELIKGLDPTPQSDIYSLGIVLCEMLTGGERPFTGERATTTGTTAAKVRWEHLHLAAPPLSSLNPKAGKGLDAIIAKCLEKDPRKRYVRTLDVYEALAALLGVGQVPTIKVNQSPGSTNDLNSPIIKEHVPASKEPEKPVFRNLMITLGISLVLYLGVNSYKNNQARQSMYAEQTQIARATGTASFKATATGTAKQQKLREIADIEDNAVKVFFSSEDMSFDLKENNSDGLLECNRINSDEYRNFIIRAEFVNPGDVSEGWDYSILFRDYGGNDQFRLIFDDSGSWILNERNDEISNNIVSGSIKVFRTSANLSNTIKLVVKADRGYLFINHDLLTELDLSSRMEAGDIFICTDNFSSKGKDGNTIHVTGIHVWELP